MSTPSSQTHMAWFKKIYWFFQNLHDNDNISISIRLFNLFLIPYVTFKVCKKWHKFSYLQTVLKCVNKTVGLQLNIDHFEAKIEGNSWKTGINLVTHVSPFEAFKIGTRIIVF